MIEELCCCGIVFFLLAIILLRLFGRTYIFYPRTQPPPAQSPYQAPGQPYSPARPPPGTSKEVNMVRCQHCGAMYAEGSEGCPNCGGS